MKHKNVTLKDDHFSVYDMMREKRFVPMLAWHDCVHCLVLLVRMDMSR